MVTGTGPAERPREHATASDHSELRDLARRLVWWLEPEAALADERRFLAQAMTDGCLDDVRLVRDAYGDEALKAVLADPPPGVFDRRSWDYWHVKLGMGEAPPLPVRRI